MYVESGKLVQREKYTIVATPAAPPCCATVVEGGEPPRQRGTQPVSAAPTGKSRHGQTHPVLVNNVNHGRQLSRLGAILDQNNAADLNVASVDGVDWRGHFGALWGKAVGVQITQGRNGVNEGATEMYESREASRLRALEGALSHLKERVASRRIGSTAETRYPVGVAGLPQVEWGEQREEKKFFASIFLRRS